MKTANQLILSAVLFLAALVPNVRGSVVINIFAGQIQTAVAGQELPSGSLLQLINLGPNGVLDEITLNDGGSQWVSGDDSLLGIAMVGDAWTTDAFPSTIRGGIAGIDRVFEFQRNTFPPGAKVGVRWFPGLLASGYTAIATAGPAPGQSYGQFTRQAGAIHGGDLWVIPGDGSNITFDSLGTDDIGGFDPSFAGVASRTVQSLPDTIPPTITFTPPPQTVDTENNATAAIPDVAALVTATDNLGVTSQTQAPIVGTERAPGIYPVVVTVSDAAGNTATATVQVSVRDNAPPVFTTCPPARPYRAASDQTSIALPDITGEAVATDNIGVTGLAQNPAAGTVLGVGTHTVTLTASDAAGNTATCNVSVTVLAGNKIPITGADYAFTGAGSILIDVLENDTDADGQPLTISAFTQSPDGGAVSIQGGQILYKPNGTVTSPRTFTYTVTDGEDSRTATVTIYRNPPVGYTYVGHLFDTDGTTIRGLMRVKIGKTGGGFSGKIFIGGKNYPAKGYLGGQSPTVVKVGVTRTFAGIPVSISAGPLGVSGDPMLAFSVPGSVPGTKWRGVMEQSPYFKTSSRQNISPATGKYTVVFEAPPGAPQPVVAGGAKVKITSPGLVTITGKHANGKGLSTASFAFTGGRVLFYSGTLKGAAFQSLAGTLTFAPAADRDVSGTVLWTVPSGFDAKIPGGLSREYDAVGARYSGTLTNSSPAKSMLDYNTSGAATLHFELPSSARTWDVAMNIGGAKTYRGPAPVSLLKFAPSSGYFTGTYSDSITRSAKFFGWVIDHPAQNRGSGYLIDTNRLGTVDLTPAP